MPKPIQISIPQPCHENWAAMTPSDKGRFCASCQKNVIDFTRASDREIAQTFKQQGNVCGKFRNDQLQRDLVVPKEKSSLWAAASAAVISFLTLGSHEALAQEPVSTEQTPIQNEEMLGKIAVHETMIITGVVSDNTGPIPWAMVTNKRTKEQVQTDLDGKYSISANIKDTLEYSFIGFRPHSIQINDIQVLNVTLDQPETLVGDIVVVKQRTFFGRIFHSIGNWFR
jgi:hypothetical protein